MNNLPDNDFIMARFIGKLLGEYRLGISDSWYALRIEKMIEERQEARRSKNFARADAIRDELLEKGIELMDTKEGVKWKKKQ